MTVIDTVDDLEQQIREAEDRFAREAPDAQMTVLLDRGPYRHLQFEAFPNASWDAFEIVTSARRPGGPGRPGLLDVRP
ncbi:hypothetical protein ACU686_26465 [Yinghuangia aomiensis]